MSQILCNVMSGVSASCKQVQRRHICSVSECSTTMRPRKLKFQMWTVNLLLWKTTCRFCWLISSLFSLYWSILLVRMYTLMSIPLRGLNKPAMIYTRLQFKLFSAICDCQSIIIIIIMRSSPTLANKCWLDCIPAPLAISNSESHFISSFRSYSLCTRLEIYSVIWSCVQQRRLKSQQYATNWSTPSPWGTIFKCLTRNWSIQQSEQQRSLPARFVTLHHQAPHLSA